jgi:superfamily II DNA or RNA helicase
MTSFKIEKVGNYGVITPKPEGKLAAMLNKKLSYERPGKEFMPNPAWALVRLYSLKRGVFPWGLRDLVDKIFTAWKDYSGDDFIWVYTYDSRAHLNISTLRPYQNDAVRALLKNGGGILCMPTGSGKTITALEYLRIMEKPSLIVVPTLDIKKMWEKKIVDLGLSGIYVINFQSPTAKELVASVDIVVFDECHHVCAKTLYNLAMCARTNTIILGCSATTEREDGEDMRMFGALGKIVYQISRRELIDMKYLSDATVHYFTPTFDTGGDYVLTYPELYEKHIVKNESRNEIAIRYAEDQVAVGKKVLILISQIEHGQFIYDKLHIEKKVFCHGTTDDRYKNLAEFDCIVASNIFNEGIDLPELDVVILAAGGKSSIQLTQRVGRVLRLKKNGTKAIIVDFQDKPKHLAKHYKKRRALLEEDFEVIDV